MQSRRHVAFPRSQRGLTLIVGLIMLILTTLLVLATFHLGRSNLDIVANAQHRDEGLGAAQQTIETAVNSPLLTTSPASIFPAPCAGFPANTLCYDVNADGTNDVVVKKDGSIYFTDGFGGLRLREKDPKKELDFGGVYMLRNGKVSRVITDIPNTNGLAFSPDEKKAIPVIGIAYQISSRKFLKIYTEGSGCLPALSFSLRHHQANCLF